MQPDRKARVGAAALLIVVAVLTAVRLEDARSMIADEGWALSVARTWVMTGHYAELVLGQPVAPTALNIGLPAIAPMALSYRLLGVGIWQGRLPSILWTLSCLLLIYALARRLYGEKVALYSVAIATMATGWLSPIFVGKQALGEMPALVFTLAGYLLLAERPARFPWRGLAAGALWGLAAATKIQVLPFILISSLALIGITLARRERGLAVLWGLTLVSMAVSLLLMRSLQVQLQRVPGAPLSSANLLIVTSAVFDLGSRTATLLLVLALALPACLGLCHAAVTAPRPWDRSAASDGTELVRWNLILLSASWFAWYLALAAGWMRYLVVPLYVSSIFAAEALVSLSGREGLASLFRRSAQSFKRSRADRGSVLALCLLLALAMTTALALTAFSREYLSPADHAVEEVARYLNTRSEPNAVIESYEMQLFPLLERPYHYPQPAAMDQLLRRNVRGEDIRIDYDPLQADPEYLVTGPVNSQWGVYDEAISSGEFEQQWSAGSYRVYKRVERGLRVPPLEENLLNPGR